jgi:integrase/recombinase XerD
MNTQKTQKMQATARIYFQKAPAKRNVDDLCPVKLCITHKRTRKYYSISDKIKDTKWLFLSVADIKKVTGESPRGKYRDILFEFERITDEAEKVINDIIVFSFNQFEEKYFHKSSDWDNLFVAMVDHIKSLKEEERFGYAASFESTIRSVKEFHEGKTFDFNSRQIVESRYNDYISGKPLTFYDITPSWLKRFESYLIKNKKSRSTIGIYVRNIRVLFNIATKIHKIKAEYPFSIHKPKTSEGRKIALTAQQIGLLANYKTVHPQERFYRDLFMFSFFGSGMNISDIARLKYSNVIEGELWFVREKTKNKETKEEKLHVPITKTMQSIIDRHGVQSIGYDGYIFPILNPEMSEEKKFRTIKEAINRANDYVSKIAKRVGINEHVSTYVARHSWATISKNSGASVEFLSEALGHSSVKVTQGYLKSFEKSTREQHSEKMENEIYRAV